MSYAVQSLFDSSNMEESLTAHKEYLEDSHIALSTVIAKAKQHEHEVDLETSGLPDIGATTVAIESLIERIESNSNCYPLFKTAMESMVITYGVKASTLPSTNSFNKNPTLGTQVSLESAVSFLGQVFESIINAIKIVIKGIINLVKDIWTWVKSFFGPSLVKTEEIVKQAPNVNVVTNTPDNKILETKTKDNNLKYGHNGRRYTLRVRGYVAKLFWDNNTKDISKNIADDLHRLNELFNSAFKHELDYRKNKDLSHFENKLKAIRHFTYPTNDDNKSIPYGKDDQNIMTLSTQIEDSKERADYLANTVDVYLKNKQFGSYIGGLQLIREEGNFATFKQEIVGFDEQAEYQIETMDKGEILYLVNILKTFERDFNNNNLVEEISKRYLDLCDKFDADLKNLKGRLNKGKITVESKKRIRQANTIYGKEIQLIRSSVIEFRQHATNVLLHIMKMAQAVQKGLIIPNEELLEKIAKKNNS